MDRSLRMDTGGSSPLQVTCEASALAPGHLPDYTEPIPHGFKGTEETPKHRAAEPVRWWGHWQHKEMTVDKGTWSQKMWAQVRLQHLLAPSLNLGCFIYKMGITRSHLGDYEESMNNVHKLPLNHELPQLTDLRILKVSRSGVQAKDSGPGPPNPCLWKRTLMVGPWLSQLSGTSAPSLPPITHWELRSQTASARGDVLFQQCHSSSAREADAGDTWGWDEKSEWPAWAAHGTGVRKPGEGVAPVGATHQPWVKGHVPTLDLLSSCWQSWAEHLPALTTGWLRSQIWSTCFSGLVWQHTHCS